MKFLVDTHIKIISGIILILGKRKLRVLDAEASDTFMPNSILNYLMKFN
jgi:hypothetical protein